jgi:acyl-CoA thioesterase FadM
MYPIVRMFWQMFKHRNDPKLGFFDTHESTHICLPWDLDIWWELNNGRTLTLFDLGRIPLGLRTGLHDVLRAKGWGMAVAGSCPRYRKRIRMFDKIHMKSRAVGMDDKFLYIEQSMWRPNGECAGHVLIRGAITSRQGIVRSDEVSAALDFDRSSKPLPEWVQAWIAAEEQRPWPPMQD